MAAVIKDPLDPDDGLPIDDVVNAIYRWADYRGINDPWILESAVRLGQEAVAGGQSPDAAVGEADGYLASFVEPDA